MNIQQVPGSGRFRISYRNESTRFWQEIMNWALQDTYTIVKNNPGTRGQASNRIQ